MKAEVGRRVFVGSVVTGLPFIAGGAVSRAQSGEPQHAHATGGADPVMDLLVRQIAAVHNAARRGPRGEHFRALAALLRTMALYQRQIGADDQVRATLRSVVERQGRNAVLYAEPDEMRRQTLLSYGFRMEGITSPQLNATHEARDAALTMLLTEGISPTFNRLAGTADKIATGTGRPHLKTVAFTPQDPDQEWWAAFCAELFRQYEEAQLIAAPVCAVAQYFSYVVPSCAALQGGAMVLLLGYLIECQM